MGNKRTNVVQGIKHSEDIKTILNRLLGEIVDSVVTAIKY